MAIKSCDMKAALKLRALGDVLQEHQEKIDIALEKKGSDDGITSDEMDWINSFAPVNSSMRKREAQVILAIMSGLADRGVSPLDFLLELIGVYALKEFLEALSFVAETPPVFDKQDLN